MSLLRQISIEGVGVTEEALKVHVVEDTSPVVNRFFLDGASSDMSVDGSVTPVSFKIQPPLGESWHVHKIALDMAHSSAGDVGLFGNLTALTNGCQLNLYDGTSSFEYTVWQTNADIYMDFGDLQFVSRSGGGGTYGTLGTGKFQDAGTVVSLSSDMYLELVVRDDLTGLGAFRMKAQGHLSLI